MLPTIGYATTARLVPPSAAHREALGRGPATRAAFAAALAEHAHVFDHVEVAPPPERRAAPPVPARIVFWNAERAKRLKPSARLLGRLDAAACLLCELDLGMARSGQAHTARELARRLRAGYAFAVEFMELGLGDALEQQWHVGEVNEAGLHGAAILSPHPLERPAVIRLEADGRWFDGRRGERRVGGRIAVAATLRIAEVPVTLACVHLESHSDPAGRGAQMEVLLEGVDAYAAGRPVLLGGDFNTSTTGRDWARGTGEKPVLPEERARDPVPYEPLFEVAAARGYDFIRCNVPGAPTQRTRPDGTPPPPLGKLDWFFTRGLTASGPQVVPAVDPSGVALSDHDLLLVEVAPG